MAGDRTAALTGPPADGDPEVERFLELIEHGRSESAIDLVLDRVHEGGSVTETVQRLLVPAQRLVGRRWHLGVYSVAQEHVASGVVEDALGLLTSHVGPSNAEHMVALVCAEGEWHTTPARMAALCLRDAGWRVQFLGGSLPPEHLTASLDHVTPRAVIVSCTLPLALDGVPALIEVCRRHQLPTLAGGHGFGPDSHRAERLGADGHALDIAAAAARLWGWLDRPPSPISVGPPTPATDHERATLATDRTELVDRSYRQLEARLPAMTEYDDHQRRHTRQDLDYILRFADITLLVDDPRVFIDFTIWLRDLLEARGVPVIALRTGLHVIADTLPVDLVRTRTVLEQGLDVLETAPEGAVVSSPMTRSPTTCPRTN